MIRKIYVLDDVEVEFRELTAKEMAELSKIVFEKKLANYDEHVLVFRKSILKIDKKTVSEDEVEVFISKLSNKAFTLANIITNDLNIVKESEVSPFLETAKEII